MRKSLSKKISTGFLNTILPPLCLSCQTPIMTQGLLCPECWSKVDFITHPRCDRLGIPLPFDTGEPMFSPAALANPPIYGRARIVASYDGVMRNLIHNYKYRDNEQALSQFGRWLETAAYDLLPDTDLIIPVPLYWSRLWSRRFNQAAELAKNLSKRTNIPHDLKTLKRVKRTKTQVGMSATQRRSNVAGAFKVGAKHKHRLENKNIILLDDVITTGATIEACAKTLLRAGATNVNILALARVTDKAPLWL